MRVVYSAALAFLLTGPLLWAQAADSAKLIPVRTDPPIYPLAAQKQGIQGQVWVKLFVTERGEVEKVEVISGDPRLTKAAVEAAKKWKFQPFIKNGKPAKVTAQMPVDFAFRDKIMENGVSADGTATVDAKTASRVQSATANSAGSPRVRIARGISEGLLLHQVAPVYPPEARQKHIEGLVVLLAIIGKDGRVRELKPLSGPKELFQAAVGAVEQWRYRPFLLNGEASEVETQITVNFTLPPGL